MGLECHRLASLWIKEGGLAWDSVDIEPTEGVLPTHLVIVLGQAASVVGGDLGQRVLCWDMCLGLGLMMNTS